MAKLPDMTKHFEELALKFLNCIKFRLSQDGVQFRDQIVEWFGKWLMVRSRRVQRYEAADLKLVDEFIDFAWMSIKDPSVPMPPEAPEPPKRGVAAAAPRQAEANRWWGRANPGGRIDWEAIQRQIFEEQGGVFPQRIENTPQQQQQWMMLDQNGNPIAFDQNGRPVNR